MPELESALRALATDIDYPQTPAFSLEQPAAPAPVPRRRAPRPTRTLALALLGALLASAVAVATLDGPSGVTVRAVDELPPTPSNVPQPGGPGERVTIAQAEELAGFDVLVLPRPPDRVRYSDRLIGGVVTLFYPPVVITEFLAKVDRRFLQKLVGAGTRVERFRLDGDPALWLEGRPHVVFMRDRDGRTIEESMRLAGNVLLVERGELLVRIEGRRLSRDEAVRLASSLR